MIYTVKRSEVRQNSYNVYDSDGYMVAGNLDMMTVLNVYGCDSELVFDL